MSSARVTTGSRLHFGLFDPTGERSDGRRFGGLGMMTSDERLEVWYDDTGRAEPKGFDHVGATDRKIARRADKFLTHVCERLEASSCPGRLVISSCPREHCGLGAGTQLGVSIAAAVACAKGLRPLVAGELARLSGRGLRSSIGVHGFVEGGLLVDAGKTPGEELSPLLARCDVPEHWRVLLIDPGSEAGLSGEAEQRSFDTLETPAQADVDRLRHLALDVMLPACRSADFTGFAEALFEFGRLAGAPFRGAQGGVFASARAARVVDFLRNEGVRGVGQSSWGPTLYAFAPGEAEARELLSRIRQNRRTLLGDTDLRVTLSKPGNRPAEIAKDA